MVDTSLDLKAEYVVAKAEKGSRTIDRSSTCPFLCQVFWRTEGEESSSSGPNPRPQMIAIHAWTDTTLRQIASLLAVTKPEAAVADHQLVFTQILLSEMSKKVDLGRVFTSRRSQIESKTLAELNFKIGNYIEVCLLQGEELPRVQKSLTSNYQDARDSRHQKRDAPYPRH